jgi:adenine-specific DNA glycosylase
VLLGARGIELLPVAEQTHVLTHRKLKIAIATAVVSAQAPRPGGEYDRFEWQKTSDLKRLGMSSLAKKVLLACPG